MQLIPDVGQLIQWNHFYNVMPVYLEVVLDTETPISIYQKVVQDEPYAFLLESVEGGEKWGRYSFVGFQPLMRLRVQSDGLTLYHRDGRVEQMEGNPVDSLEQFMSSFRCPELEDAPRFLGGLVGFFGYDALGLVERLPAHRKDDLQLPDIELMLTDQVLVIDHLKHNMRLYTALHLPVDSPREEIERAYGAAYERLMQTIRKLQSIRTHTSYMQLPPVTEPSSYHSNMTKEEFCEKVEQAKRYIATGDISQVVLSQRFAVDTEVDPLLVYRILRQTNPSPYMYILKLGESSLVGTSPELLVRIEGNRIENMPIAGTRKRGRTKEEDLLLEQELLSDPKERAEHIMLVDLGRNDLGRVSKSGTVEVDAFMKVERYSQVMHLVTHVQGQLREDVSPLQALLACLPAGTVSGAPKLRAMEIVAELEEEKRGPYAGAIGYLGYSGNMDTCITIRTILFHRGCAYIQAGAGIVWDSVPESEYQETLNKAKALLIALHTAEQISGEGVAHG